MNLRSAILGVFTLVLVCAGVPGASAQTPPQQLPRVQAANLAYLGKFTLPMADSNGQALTYGGNALGMGADGTSMYYGCVYGTSVARVTIPAIGGVATVLEPCSGVPNLNAINPSDPNAKLLGGVLAWNGRLIVTGYSFYDGAGAATKSHFAGTTIAGAAGPYKVGTEKPAFVAGYMGVIPQEWRALLGAPALTGQCCQSIISRTSYGPSVSAFDPAMVGVTNESTMLVGYPQGNETLGTYDGVSPYFNGTTRIGGVAFPAGTRSVLFIGRHGATYCYGEGTSNQALHNTPHPSGGVYCYDPTSQDKGTHGYPYKHTVYAYDANDLLAVKNGTKQAWDVIPYATFNLSQMDSVGSASMRGATYDPATGRWYMVQDRNGATPEVHVYQITSAVNQPVDPIEVCGDGIDNDSDGAVDEGCVEICGDGVDNDGDQLIDEGCAEICGDGIDNDKDGQTDEGCDSELPPPSAPRNLSGSVTGTTVSFKWNSSLTGGAVKDYILEAGAASGQSTYSVPMGLVTSFSIPNVGAGRFYVRVRATNDNGSSPPSNEVVTSVGCLERPGPMSGLKATSKAGLVRLTWVDPDGCSGTTYQIGIGTIGSATDVQTFNAPATTTTTLLPQGSYYARVTATSDAGVSTSTEARFSVTGSECAVPSFRTNLKSEVAGRNVSLLWSPRDPDTAESDDAILAVSYILEAGSARGGADLGAAPVGRDKSLQISVPPGVYFVRIRPTNACGAGLPSNEVRVQVR